MTAVDDPALVGRRRELAALAAFAEGFPAAGSTGLVLEGETGIGKTALWNAGIRLAAAAGARVLRSRPGPGEFELAFSGLADLASGLPEQAFSGLPVRQRRALESAVSRADGDSDDLAVCLAFTQALETTGLAPPVVLAVDDLQWLDGPSARVLDYALRRSHPRIALLATAPFGHELTLERVEWLDVGPLSPAEIDRLLHLRLGRRFTPPVLRRLVDLVGGNPAQALELAHAMSPDARLAPGQPLPLAGAVVERAARRLIGLREPARELLLAVACAREPTVELVERLAGGTWLETVGAELIEVDVVGRLRFTPPMLAAVVVAQASIERRHAAHRRLAGVVADPEQAALHRALAATGPDADLAITLDAAARRARGRGAPDTAAELAELAVRLTDPSAVVARRARRHAAAEHHVRAGDGPRARALLEAVLADQPPGRDRSLGLTELASIAETTTRVVALGERALSEAADDDDLRSSAHIVLGTAAAAGGDLLAWSRHVAAAPGGSATARSQAALVRFCAGHGNDEQVAVETPCDDPLCSGIEMPWHRPDLSLAFQLIHTGDFVGARSLIGDRRRKIRYDHREQLPAVTPDAGYCAYLLTQLELRAGRWRRADRHADEAVAANASRSWMLRPAALGVRALVDAHLGRVECAERTAHEGLELADETGAELFAWQNRRVLGFLALSLDDPARAHAEFAPVLAAMSARGFREPTLVPVGPDEVEALVAIGAATQAQGLVDQLLAMGRRLGRGWAVAAAHRGDALIAAASGDEESAVRAIDAALEEYARIVDPFGRARALLIRGAVLRRAGRRSASRAALDEAHATFGALGAPLWSARAERERQRLGGRRPRSPSGLTATEERVAALVELGRTNREIAAELFVTVKTVETNMSRIFRKLGVRSRVEVARRVAGRE